MELVELKQIPERPRKTAFLTLERLAAAAFDGEITDVVAAVKTAHGWEIVTAGGAGWGPSCPRCLNRLERRAERLEEAK